MVRSVPLALALLVASVAPSAAQALPATEPAPTPSAPRTLVGTWELSNADREKICTVTFRPDSSKSGKKVEFDPGCGERFSFTKEIVGWSHAENDFLRLLDVSGQAVLEFSEVEGGIFEAPRPGEGILFIQSAASLGPAPRIATQMTGDWTIVRRAGRPICTLTLSDTPAGDEFVIRVQPRCDASVARFAPATWQMDRGELVLKSSGGQSWRFEEAEDSKWHRIPATADPVLMVRK